MKVSKETYKRYKVAKMMLERGHPELMIKLFKEKEVEMHKRTKIMIELTEAYSRYKKKALYEEALDYVSKYSSNRDSIFRNFNNDYTERSDNMARTKKPYIAFETKEDFDKSCDEFYNSGRKQGFEDGCVWTLSYFYELMQDMFKPEAFGKAQYEIKHRHIEKWNKEQTIRSLKEELELRDIIKKVGEEAQKEFGEKSSES